MIKDKLRVKCLTELAVENTVSIRLRLKAGDPENFKLPTRTARLSKFKQASGLHVFGGPSRSISAGDHDEGREKSTYSDRLQGCAITLHSGFADPESGLS